MTTEARAAEMFAAGESVNAVAKALEITWAAAKKLQGGGASTAPKKRGGRRKSEPAEEVAADEQAPEIWDVQLAVPDSALDGIIATFTRQEKAAAINSVLQTRMDALVAG